MSTQTDILNNIPIDPHTGAIAVPIYQTSTFEQQAPGEHKGYDYTRTNNPTREVLENLIAKLEHGVKGFAFGSGLAAIDAVFKTLSSKDEVIAVANIYGGTYRLLNDVYAKFGIITKYVDTTEVENITSAITSQTKIIWIESPTNPTLRISDIKAIAEIAKKNHITLCVDNTFATPIAQKPIDLGADIVIHSATKYIAGHSDVVAGLVITKTEELGKRIKFHQNSTGAILSPFDSFLTIRGIETLLLRYKAYSDNAQKVAEYLSNHPKINNIYYPGLTQHPGHKLAKEQQKYFGAVISFDLIENKEEHALKLLKNLRQFILTEGLGGIKSLSNYPNKMSHGSVPTQLKRDAGISESLIRLSIGLEEPQELIKDLEQALLQL